jgi:hypothetical protein
MVDINSIWEDSDFESPQIFYGSYRNEWYVTISDDESIFKFMSRRGDIYVVIAEKCHIIKGESPNPDDPEDGGSPDYYEIEKLQIITCSRKEEMYSSLERFIYENLLDFIPE